MATLTSEPKQFSRGRGSTRPAVSGSRLFNRLCMGVMIAFSIIWLIPLLWAVDTAFKYLSVTPFAELA